MRMPRHRARGYVLVVTMLLLAIGTVLTAWVYGMTTTGTAVARNDTAQTRVMMAAESGMQFVMGKLQEVTTDEFNPISETTDAANLYKIDLALVQAWKITGHPLSPPSDPANPIVSISGVPLAEGGRFDMDLRLSTSRPTGFTLTITGYAGSLSRTIGAELVWRNRAPGWMLYPLLSKGPMGIVGASDIFNWDSDMNRADTGDPGQVHAFEDGSGQALCYRDTPLPTTSVFPPKYPDASVYTKLNAMRDANVLQGYTGKDANGAPIATSTLQNVYIAPNSNITLANASTLTGIIYVGWPNTLNLGESTTLNGIIIYEKPPANYQPPRPDRDSPSCINADRAITMACNTELGTANVYSAFLSACSSGAEAQAYMDAIWPWTVIAPDTDWNMTEGRTVSSFQFVGNIHIRDLTKAAGSGNGSPDTYAFHGSIVCEGLVDFRGDREISIEPPDSQAAENVDNAIGIAMAPGGYWER